MPALFSLWPVLLTYVLSFVYIGIYGNNHHHMLHMTTRVNGKILWANLHLLFWLSLIPFTTGWMGENHFTPIPTAIYGVDLLLCGVAYAILSGAIMDDQGAHSKLRAAVGKDVKGKMSALLYALAIPLALFHAWMAIAIFAGVAPMWLVPDRRIEERLDKHT